VERRKILPLLELKLRTLSHTTRSQSLYRLRYPGSQKWPCRLYKNMCMGPKLFSGIFLSRRGAFVRPTCKWQCSRCWLWSFCYIRISETRIFFSGVTSATRLEPRSLEGKVRHYFYKIPTLVAIIHMGFKNKKISSIESPKPKLETQFIDCPIPQLLMRYIEIYSTFKGSRKSRMI
jgi:hypothetical protein